MLLIMRHAKSDWSTKTTDHQRPLNQRGLEAAARMGALLTEMDLTPDLVITSTALRANTTAKLAADAGGWDCEIRATDAFYEAGVDGVIAELRTLESGTARCLIVGHNPTLTGLVHQLTGGFVAMKTATVAAVQTPSQWSLLADDHYGRPTCELFALLQPRHFEP